jgi:hypothetical protein
LPPLLWRPTADRSLRLLRLVVLLILEFVLVVLLFVIVGSIVIPRVAPSLQASPTPTAVPSNG